MKIFTVGSKSFVTSFQLAGIPGIISETPDSALTEITKLTDDSDVGLVLVSDDITCLLYTSPSPRDRTRSRMPSSA